jgi:hypothetical protein
MDGEGRAAREAPADQHLVWGGYAQRLPGISDEFR